MFNGRVLVQATVTAVLGNRPIYRCCRQCYIKLLFDFRKNSWLCRACQIHHQPDDVSWRYCLNLTVADGDSACNVAVFGKTLEPFFGVSANNFNSITENLNNYNDSSETLSRSLEETFVGNSFLFGFKSHTSIARLKKSTSSPISLAQILNGGKVPKATHCNQVRNNLVAVLMMSPCLSQLPTVAFNIAKSKTHFKPENFNSSESCNSGKEDELVTCEISLQSSLPEEHDNSSTDTFRSSKYSSFGQSTLGFSCEESLSKSCASYITNESSSLPSKLTEYISRPSAINSFGITEQPKDCGCYKSLPEMSKNMSSCSKICPHTKAHCSRNASNIGVNNDTSRKLPVAYTQNEARLENIQTSEDMEILRSNDMSFETSVNDSSILLAINPSVSSKSKMPIVEIERSCILPNVSVVLEPNSNGSMNDSVHGIEKDLTLCDGSHISDVVLEQLFDDDASWLGSQCSLSSSVSTIQEHTNNQESENHDNFIKYPSEALNNVFKDEKAYQHQKQKLHENEQSFEVDRQKHCTPDQKKVVRSLLDTFTESIIDDIPESEDIDEFLRKVSTFSHSSEKEFSIPVEIPQQLNHFHGYSKELMKSILDAKNSFSIDHTKNNSEEPACSSMVPGRSICKTPEVAKFNTPMDGPLKKPKFSKRASLCVNHSNYDRNKIIADANTIAKVFQNSTTEGKENSQGHNNVCISSKGNLEMTHISSPESHCHTCVGGSSKKQSKMFSYKSWLPEVPIQQNRGKILQADLISGINSGNVINALTKAELLKADYGMKKVQSLKELKCHSIGKISKRKWIKSTKKKTTASSETKPLLSCSTPENQSKTSVKDSRKKKKQHAKLHITTCKSFDAQKANCSVNKTKTKIINDSSNLQSRRNSYNCGEPCSTPNSLKSREYSRRKLAGTSDSNNLSCVNRSTSDNIVRSVDNSRKLDGDEHCVDPQMIETLEHVYPLDTDPQFKSIENYYMAGNRMNGKTSDEMNSKHCDIAKKNHVVSCKNLIPNHESEPLFSDCDESVLKIDCFKLASQYEPVQSDTPVIDMSALASKNSNSSLLSSCNSSVDLFDMPDVHEGTSRNFTTKFPQTKNNSKYKDPKIIETLEKVCTLNTDFQYKNLEDDYNADNRKNGKTGDETNSKNCGVAKKDNMVSCSNLMPNAESEPLFSDCDESVIKNYLFQLSSKFKPVQSDMPVMDRSALDNKVCSNYFAFTHGNASLYSSCNSSVDLFDTSDVHKDISRNFTNKFTLTKNSKTCQDILTTSDCKRDASLLTDDTCSIIGNPKDGQCRPLPFHCFDKSKSMTSATVEDSQNENGIFELKKKFLSNQNRHVTFSRRLSHVSSVNLMDIQMRLTSSPINNIHSTSLKSCLKKSQMIEASDFEIPFSQDLFSPSPILNTCTNTSDNPSKSKRGSGNVLAKSRSRPHTRLVYEMNNSNIYAKSRDKIDDKCMAQSCFGMENRSVQHQTCSLPPFCESINASVTPKRYVKSFEKKKCENESTSNSNCDHDSFSLLLTPELFSP